MLDKKNKIQNEEKAVLVGLVHKEQTETQMNEYLAELAFLAETAGAVTVRTFMQKLPRPDSKTFVGKGKLQELSQDFWYEVMHPDLLCYDVMES